MVPKKLDKTVEQELNHNNIVSLKTHTNSKENTHIGAIVNGTVIDHIEPKKADEIDSSLGFTTSGYLVLKANNLGEPRKDLMKIAELYIRTNAELRQIMEISPNATINHIMDGEVADKFTAIFCENKKCDTHVNDDVASVFEVDDVYNDGEDDIVCASCGEIYDGDFKGRDHYISELKRDADFDSLTQGIREKLEELKSNHAVNGMTYDGIQSDCLEKTDEHATYLNLVKDMIGLVQERVYGAFFFDGYDVDNKCNREDLQQEIDEALIDCGFGKKNISIKKVASTMMDQGIGLMMEKDEGFLKLAPNARELYSEKCQDGVDCMSYVISNAVRAVDYMVDLS